MPKWTKAELAGPALALWKAPRLRAEGRPFAPSDLEVGATVRLRCRLGSDVEAVGQVWSKTSRDGEVFVVLEDQRAIRVCSRNKHGAVCAGLDHPAPFSLEEAAA